jgi:hypothetical protein
MKKKVNQRKRLKDIKSQVDDSDSEFLKPWNIFLSIMNPFFFMAKNHILSYVPLKFLSN